jgi:hypothetical protein
MVHCLAGRLKAIRESCVHNCGVTKLCLGSDWVLAKDQSISLRACQHKRVDLIAWEVLETLRAFFVCMNNAVPPPCVSAAGRMAAVSPTVLALAVSGSAMWLLRMRSYSKMS